MSVILDIDMPKTARDCIFNQPAPFRKDCCAINNVCTFPDGCPLHEIKPHGRLIDADSLMKRFGMSADCYICKHGDHGVCGFGSQFSDICEALECAPTIIEAEVEE